MSPHPSARSCPEQSLGDGPPHPPRVPITVCSGWCPILQRRVEARLLQITRGHEPRACGPLSCCLCTACYPLTSASLAAGLGYWGGPRKGSLKQRPKVGSSEGLARSYLQTSPPETGARILGPAPITFSGLQGLPSTVGALHSSSGRLLGTRSLLSVDSAHGETTAPPRPS